jgi:transposase
MQAYSLDLRQRIAQACAEPGVRQAQVAARFSVSVAFIGKLLQRQRQTGQLAALPGRGGPARCLDAAAQAWLGEQVAAQPDATLAELQTLLLVERGQVVSRGSVWRVLHEQGWRRKKKPARH